MKSAAGTIATSCSFYCLPAATAATAAATAATAATPTVPLEWGWDSCPVIWDDMGRHGMIWEVRLCIPSLKVLLRHQNWGTFSSKHTKHTPKPHLKGLTTWAATWVGTDICRSSKDSSCFRLSDTMRFCRFICRMFSGIY